MFCFMIREDSCLVQLMVHTNIFIDFLTSQTIYRQFWGYKRISQLIQMGIEHPLNAVLIGANVAFRFAACAD